MRFLLRVFIVILPSIGFGFGGVVIFIFLIGVVFVFRFRFRFGDIYYILLVCTKVFWGGHLHDSLRRSWVFCRAFGCGARTGGPCTPRRKFESRAGSVARAPGVQSREIWQVK